MKYLVTTLLVVSFLFYSCKKDELRKTVAIKQYGSTVLNFSSQFSETNWSAEQLLDTPNSYPSYGDISTAWSFARPDSMREFIEIGFKTSQFVAEIEIYETFNPGAIDSVFLRNENDKKWLLVWSGTATEQTDTSRIFTIALKQTTYFVDALRITMDSENVEGY
ncbi:MAG: hypothetical protein ACJAZ3_001099, partial [Sphingobacteriales bacterium]